MTEQLRRIQAKIKALKGLDKGLTLFGSQRHKYLLNPTLPVQRIKQFEQACHVSLPIEYVQFMTELGNGGVGPFYGLEPFENALFDDLDYKRPDSLLDPSKPFLHTEAWNLEFHSTADEDTNEEEYEQQRLKFEETYYDPAQRNGVLAICNFGCAISLNLVVNGQEYGYIWTDDRGSDKGIYPSQELGNKGRIGFLNWYELWLDNSLNELKATLSLPPENSTEMQGKRPWWIRW
ncbi:MAG: SMI1/KNR4 family protein [Williamsia sp.]|nr:SMI1/KNR4 family protein [Williamsia sp.]